MNSIKEIYIISNETQIIDPIRINVFKQSTRYKLTFVNIQKTFLSTMELILREKPTRIRKCDLILFIYAKIDDNIERKMYFKKLHEIYNIYRKKILVVLSSENNILITNESFKYKIISSSDFYKGNIGIEIIDILLNIPVTIQKTTIISQTADEVEFLEDDEQWPEKVIDSDKLKLSDRMRTSHLFSDKEKFTSWHVKLSQETMINLEEESDRIIDNEYAHINTVEDFYNVYTNEERITYFLIGHRGSGKSCFLRYFYEYYYADKNPDEPYVIIDFLRFGFISNDDSLKFSILEALFNHFDKNKIRSLIDKYHVVDDLFSIEEVSWVIDYYIEYKNQYLFTDVFSGFLRHSIEMQIGRLGKIDVGKKIAEEYEKFNADDIHKDEDYINVYILYSRNVKFQWLWMKHLWDYISAYSKDKPFRFFVRTMVENIFFRETNEYGASFELFRKNETLINWKDKYLNEGIINLKTYDESGLEDLVNDLIQTIIDTFKSFHIVLDNMDQLDASLADYDIYNTVSRKIAKYWPKKISFVVAMRPSTVDTINEDFTAYKKFWLPTIDLKKVIEKRTQTLLEMSEKKEEKDFLLNLQKILNYPVAINQYSKDKNMTISKLICQLCGNNIREGKEIFAELIDNWYPYFNKVGSFGFLREIEEKGINKGFYIAEHIALHSIFMENTKRQKLKNYLLNVFQTPGLENHKGVLLQLRILEILKKVIKQSLKDFFQTLQLLGYTNDEIESGVLNLKIHRLISMKPFQVKLDSESNDTIIFIRYRGYTYLNLIRKLSYIQMVYFTTELPIKLANRFSYPNHTMTKDLKELCHNFLDAIWLYINKQYHDVSQEKIDEYTTIIRSPFILWNDINCITKDLSKIYKIKL